MPEFRKAVREELALAILLWKDFKDQGQVDVDVWVSATKLVSLLGVEVEFDKLLTKMPAMNIVPRETRT